jgi:hypothetical protein
VTASIPACGRRRASITAFPSRHSKIVDAKIVDAKIVDAKIVDGCSVLR